MIDVPQFSVQLLVTTQDSPSFGTGFLVEYAGVRWLVTCRHLLESEKFDFTGSCSAQFVSIVNPTNASLFLRKDRRVVGVRVAGKIADAVAIQLEPGEAINIPIFPGATLLPASNVQLRRTVPVETTDAQRRIMNVSSNYWVQGYPNVNPKPPVTIQAYGLAGVPSPYIPWMISYTPSAGNGVSGGPVILMTPGRMQLIGIHAHSFSVEFGGRTEVGARSMVSVRMGGAVPITFLLRAIEDAPNEGESIIDVSADSLD